MLTALAAAVKPLAYVVCHYTCSDRQEKAAKDITHPVHLPSATRVGKRQQHQYNKNRQYPQRRKKSFSANPLANFQKVQYNNGAPLRTSSPKESCASVAQLDRAFGSDPEGRWFESSRAHQKRTAACILLAAVLS